MEIREVVKQPKDWNKLAGHPLQSWEWGKFRQLTGVGVVRYGVFSGEKLIEPVTITVHPIPHAPWTIGYYPKGGIITKEIRQILEAVARDNGCVYIKCEPRVEVNNEQRIGNREKMQQLELRRGRALFTPHNFVLDVTKSEEELLAGMKQKTRYNIRVAEKRGVTVEVDNSDEAFEQYLKLTKETAERQGFYAHSEEYHRKMWKVLGKMNSEQRTKNNVGLRAELLVARFKGEVITTWVLFTHNDTLYYPYGASTRKHRELMANNLVMWEAIRLAKKQGRKYFDMWGALESKPDQGDPWYGFHKFKEGYGGRHVTYTESLDYVARPLLYYPLRVAEELRWKWLRLVR